MSLADALCSSSALDVGASGNDTEKLEWVPSTYECLGDVFFAAFTSAVSAFAALAFLCCSWACSRPRFQFRRVGSAAAVDGTPNAADSSVDGHVAAAAASTDNSKSCFEIEDRRRKVWRKKITAAEFQVDQDDAPYSSHPPTPPIGWGRFHTWRCLLSSCLFVVHLSEVAEAVFGGSLIFLTAPLASILALLLTTTLRLSFTCRFRPSLVSWIIFFFWGTSGAAGRALRVIGSPPGPVPRFRAKAAAIAALFYAVNILTDAVDVFSRMRTRKMSGGRRSGDEQEASGEQDKDSDPANRHAIPCVYKHAKANAFSKAIFFWLTPLLRLGFSRPLELEDLGRLPDEERTRVHFDRFHKIFEEEKRRCSKRVPSSATASGSRTKMVERNVSLWRCYCRFSWAPFCLGGFLKLLGDSAGLVGPLAISVIIDYASSVSTTEAPYPTVSEFFNNGYVMAVVMLLGSIAQGTLSQASTHLVNVEGIRLKGALQALVYDKALHLSAWSVNQTEEGIAEGEGGEEPRKEEGEKDGGSKDEGRKESRPGDDGKGSASDGGPTAGGADAGAITNLVADDAFNVMSFVWVGHYTWAIPLKVHEPKGFPIMHPMVFESPLLTFLPALIKTCIPFSHDPENLSQIGYMIGVLMYLLYLKLGLSAIIGAAFCILTMTPLQFLIGKMMSSNSKIVSEVSDERLRKTNEILQGIKLLKLYGWEDIYLRQIEAIREKELALLDKDSFYWAVMTFLTHASSVLVTLVTFGTHLALEQGGNSTLTPANVFAALALFNQLTVPLFIFPVTVPIAINAMVSTRRLEDFLSLPEMNCCIPTQLDEEETEEEERKSRKGTPDNHSGSVPPYTENSNPSETPSEANIPVKSAAAIAGSQDSVFGLGNIEEDEEEPEEDEEDSEKEKSEVVSNNSITNKEESAKEPVSEWITKCCAQIDNSCAPKTVKPITSSSLPNNFGNGPRTDTFDAVEVHNGIFSWCADPQRSLSNNLLKLSRVHIPKGKLTLVVGPVGSGKTSLLSALLGEMHLQSGSLKWGSGATIAYAAQKPWLLNATVRANILFGSVFRLRRYNRVVSAVALQPDMDILPGKDLTVIGENGIHLSGGQKQRVALARTLYSRASIIMLDDPLSALDYQVGHHVFEEGIRKLLLRQKRTIILVTHHLQLLSHAYHIIAMENGQIRSQGSLMDIEKKDPELFQTWKSSMMREMELNDWNDGKSLPEGDSKKVSMTSIREAVGTKTAKERWQLVRLVSRISSHLRQNIISDGTWQTEEEAHVAPPLVHPFRNRAGTASSMSRRSARRHLLLLSHDLPLPTDECHQDDHHLLHRRTPSTSLSFAQGNSSAFSVHPVSHGQSWGHRAVLRASSLQSPPCPGRHQNQNATTVHSLVRRLSTPNERPDPVVHGSISSNNAEDVKETTDENITTESRTYTIGSQPQGSFLRRLFSISSQRSMTGPFDSNNIKEKNMLKRLMSTASSKSGTSGPGEADHQHSRRFTSSTSGLSDDIGREEDEDAMELDDEDPDNKINGAATEEREYGKIPRRTYLRYFFASGPLVGVIYLTSTLAWQALRVYTDFWLSEWTEAGAVVNLSRKMNSTDFYIHTSQFISKGQREEMMHYLAVYAMLSLGSIMLSLASNGVGQWGGSRARRNLHSKMLSSVLLKFPHHFFETTPLGRIINRFSTDTAVIDKKIATSIQRLLQFLLLCLSAILVNSVVTSWFLLAAIPICIIYYIVQKFFRSSSRELQRLDSITRSPIFSHFSETLGGLATIRAFGHQGRFSKELAARIDCHTNAFLIVNTGNRWLGIALDYLGGAIVFVSAVAALVTSQLLPNVVTPALVGLAINYTLLLPIYLHWVVKFLSDMEAYMGAVERMEQYIKIPSEDNDEDKPGITSKITEVPDDWPSKGDILFEGVTLTYEKSRDPVITNLNLHIPTGQKVGICGRTGSGKSSIVMSLFRMVNISEGRILIDGIDIKTVPIRVLRSRLSIIPQDVIMFGGTIRENLDPHGKYKDEQIWSSLELAQLKEVVSAQPGGLDGEVREGGENWSGGQRQLFCLARAILHGATCLFMDEATSSVDAATEGALQKTATKAFSGRTVITIAHRITTILDCDRILVLDGGHVAEDGAPNQLLSNQSGIFSSMLKASEAGAFT